MPDVPTRNGKAVETMDAVPSMGKRDTLEDPSLNEVERNIRRKTDKKRQRSTLSGTKIKTGGCESHDILFPQLSNTRGQWH